MSVESTPVPGPSAGAALGASSRGRRLQQVFDALGDMVVLIEREEDGGYRWLEANEAVSRMEGIPLEVILGKRVDEVYPPEAYARWKAVWDKVAETRAPLEVEHEADLPGGKRNLTTRFLPVPEDGSGRCLLMGVSRDETASRRLREDGRAHLRRLEALNRVSLTLAEDLDVEVVLQRLTAVLLEVFAADRAWLAHPLDPEAGIFHLPFITSRPEYPGPTAHASLPLDPVSREIIREVHGAEGPVAYDAARPMPGGEGYRALFGIRSQMLMAVRLKDREAWCVGLHQCSREREWSAEDRALFQDIVARVRISLQNLLLHRDLRRSGEFHHLMTEVLPQLLWTTDGAGKVVYVNSRWMEFTGQDEEHSLGSGGLDALHPEDVEACREKWGRALATGTSYEGEFRYRRADGAYVWHLTRAYPIRDEGGRVCRWIGTCTDISEAKRVQEEAARARRELEVILQGVGEGISAQDPDGNLIYANQRFAEISGFPDPASLLASPLAERKDRYAMFDEAGRPLAWKDLPGRRVLAGEAQAALTMRLIDRVAGTERWVDSKSTSVRGPDGRVTMVINFSQDITAVREKEEAMRRLQRMESLGKLAGGIAHDFNNLLVTINGYSELGLRGTAGVAEREEYFGEILRSGRRAAALTQQLLAYSRKQVVMPRALSLNTVVADMEKLLRRLIGEDIRLRSVLAEGLPLVMADLTQLEQVIMNLVVNARDAMPAGGSLVLETSACRLDSAALVGNPDARPGEFVRLVVTDTGTGMTPEVLERAFEPFFTTKEVGKGTGLGLASVYGIVKQAGGHIEVKSAPGAGSAFAIHLPASPGAAAPGEDPEARAVPRAARSGVVLLVEDEDSVRAFTFRVLSDRGYRVLAARDGAEALRIARDLPALHLLLTDVVMPNMRGTALAAEIRDLHPAARILLMSGYLEEGLAGGAGTEEAPAFLQKPFKVEELLDRVEAVLEGARP